MLPGAHRRPGGALKRSLVRFQIEFRRFTPVPLDRRKRPPWKAGEAQALRKRLEKCSARPLAAEKNIWLHLHANQGSSRKRTSSSPYNTSLKHQGKTRGAHVTSETTQMTRQHAPSGFQNHVNAMLKSPNRAPERLSCQCHLFHGRDQIRRDAEHVLRAVSKGR